MEMRNEMLLEWSEQRRRKKEKCASKRQKLEVKEKRPKINLN